MRTVAGIIVPSVAAPTELITGTFLVALVIICAFYFTRRKK
ncbi:hypothetical protein OKJ48_43840 [Streptomyces kunmingensis]|uniref:Uncharacterized protein n=1 Tax=Streptomyces kunmingensis TaxID=68225 RepID=A0ABU6CQU9_9ACTN|nr:hypothetical protein [Streptomyces kunmingensis]MEB3967121.1 hypothetical protein [Streptomyces kunmingensis]